MSDRVERIVLPIATVLLAFCIWELAGRVIEFNPLFFSYPSQILQGFVTLTRGPLLEDLRASGIEFALGLAIALIGIPFGMVVGWNRRLRYALDPVINALYSTPIVALTPLFVIWFGLGLTSKVAIVAVVAFFPLVINVVEGVSTVDIELVRAARSFGGRRRDLYIDVVLPSIVPFIVSGMRLAIRGAVIGVVIGEFIGAVSGVGYRVRVHASIFQTPLYLAGIGILVAFSVVLNFALKALEARLAPWRAERRIED